MILVCPFHLSLVCDSATQQGDLGLGLVDSHTVDFSPSIQLVQIPLQSLSFLQQIETHTQLGVIYKLAEGAPNPFVQVIDKDIKKDWPEY